MVTIEIIGACVGIVATVLGGVWFIVNKAFGVGRFSHRIDEVDKRTVNAACDLHGRDIDAMKSDMRTIKTDVATINAAVELHGKDIDTVNDNIRTMRSDIVAIKSLLTMKHKDAASLCSIKNSPRQLNGIGKQVMNDMKGAEFLEAHKDFFFSLIDAYKPKTALDVENAAHSVCVSNTNNDMFNGLKLFVYNSPSYIVKDVNGQERPYDLSLPDVCFILSLPLRDMYLKEHPEILTE